MKERSKKKLARSTWAVHVEQIGDKKSPEMSICPENRGEMEAMKTEIAMWDCINSNLERVGAEWKIMIDRRNRKPLTENIVREK